MPSTTKLKLAIVSDAVYPYNKGGKEVRIHELSTRLAASGFDVTIYTMKWWDGPETERYEDGVKLRAISPLYPLYSGERRSIKQGLLFGLACFKLMGERFDIIDVDHMPYFPLFAGKIVSLLKRKPMYATWHEVWGRPYWKEYLGHKGMIAYAVERISVLLPNKIIAVSGLTAGRLTAEIGALSPILVVANGIDLESIAQVRPAKAVSDVIYVGRLLEHKNIDVLLRAVAQVKLNRPNISCAIVGDGPERERLEQLSAALGLQPNVTFTGFLPRHEEKFALMKSSKVFVTPSTREGFGITVLEANACGLPVVSIDHPQNAAKDLITTTNGRLVKLDVDQIATAISALLNQPLKSAGVLDFAKSWDWENAAVALRKVYAR